MMFRMVVVMIILIVLNAIESEPDYDMNQYPVIGVMTQTMDKAFDFVDQNQYKSYIMKAYIQYLEQAGAQVIPILYDETKQQLENKLNMIDGLFLPGGAGDYYENGKYLFNRIIEINDQGRFLPIWGTCLGFEAILNYSDPNILKQIRINHQSINIQITKRDSQLYSQFSDYDIQLLQNNNLTYNNHDYSVTVEDMNRLDMYESTAISYNQQQQQFVSSFESKQYPIYGFHPEKPFTIYKKHLNINHSWESIRVQRKFSDYFIKLCRMNQRNSSQTDLQSHLIDNHKLVTSDTGYANVYVFQQANDQ